MKKVLQASLLAVALLIGANANAQSPIEIGVKGGANLSNLSGDTDDTTESKFGFNAGVTFSYNFKSNIILLTGIEFTNKGAELKYLDYTINASFIQVPVHIGYKVPISETMKVVFDAGPYFAYGIGGKTKFSYDDAFGKPISGKVNTFGDDSSKRFDFGLGLGAGVEFGQIGVGIGWDFGLTDLGRDNISAKTQNGYLSVGYKFSL